MPLLNLLLLVLAVLGVLALLSRVFRSFLRFGLAAAEATATDGLIEVSARRGDLTALAERRAHAEAARRARARAVLHLLLWLLLLVVPPLLGWAREVYVAASVLWLLPRQPLLPRRPPDAAEA